MIFASVPLEECEGAILAHSQLIGGRRIPKGRILSAADIAAAANAGMAHLTVARLEPGDVPEDEAATRLGAALAGPHVVAEPPVHGRVNLVAGADGLLMFDVEPVNFINSVDEAITLGVLAPCSRVSAGDVVATIKVIPFAVSEASLASTVAAAVPLEVAPFRTAQAVLIQTRLPGQPDKLFAKTVEVTRARLAALGATLAAHEICPHDPHALADRLARATGEIVLVAGASATADRRDVIPSAIESAGGRIERLGMPVDPGNLLCLGYLSERPVVGLPGCARSPKRNGADLVLERLVAGLPVESSTIARLGVGGVLPELDRPEPRGKTLPGAGPVGAIVLAAGRSTRMGGNKLLADLGGKAIVERVLDSIEAAGLPAIVVLGNMANDVQATLRDRATFVTAPDYAEGLSRSLRAGVAAAPDQWRAAVVCLGDMPEVPPTVLHALASASRGPHDILVPTFNGKRGNPVLWGRAHFPRLMSLSGDVGGKALLSEYVDQVREIEVDTDAILTDVDTPDALAALRERHRIS